MNQGHCLAWAEVPETVSPSGVVKRVILGAGASLFMVQVPAGTRGERHSHPHEQFVHVVAGSGRLNTEQGERAFAAGSVFHFPADAWHSATFDSDTILIETNLQQQA